MVSGQIEVDWYLLAISIFSNNILGLDKAPRLIIRRVIWILASDTVPIITNTETAMLSNQNRPKNRVIFAKKYTSASRDKYQLTKRRKVVMNTSK